MKSCIKECPTCKEKFKSVNGKKYCRSECYFNSKNRKRIIPCNSCGKLISSYSDKKWCNQTCYRKGQNEIRNCMVCEKEFKVSKSVINRGNNAGKFCSIKCAVTYRVKENNPNWRGGKLVDENKKARERRFYRDSIRLRDNYTCKKCGVKEKDIQHDVHHIIPYRISQDNSDNNLITLCHSCHMKEAAIERKLYKK